MGKLGEVKGKKLNHEDQYVFPRPELSTLTTLGKDPGSDRQDIACGYGRPEGGEILWV
jgi:hypothetical protein